MTKVYTVGTVSDSFTILGLTGSWDSLFPISMSPTANLVHIIIGMDRNAPEWAFITGMDIKINLFYASKFITLP